MTRSRIAFATLTAILILFGFNVAAAPRPLSDAERAATQIAAEYLSRGPQAVAEHLAAHSPLRHFNGQAQLDEIETRLGPPAGATWELQTVVPAIADRTAVFAIEFPSGIDESAIVDLVKEPSGWTINDIRTLGQRSPKPPLFPPLPPVKPEDAPKQSFPDPAIGMVMIGLAALLAIGGAFTHEEKPLLSRGRISATARL